jgi:hypothetical protein
MFQAIVAKAHEIEKNMNLSAGLAHIDMGIVQEIKQRRLAQMRGTQEQPGADNAVGRN